MMKQKNAFTALTVLLSIFLVTGCVSKFDVNKTTQQDALSIVQVEVHIDGTQAKGDLVNGFCYPAFSLKTAKVAKNAEDTTAGERIDGAATYLLKSASGTIDVIGFSCSEFRVLYNKQRIHKFTTPITFTAAAGKVSYPGKLRIDYKTSGFGVSDFFGLPEQGSDDFRVKVKVVDDFQDAQAKFLEKYKTLPAGFSFEKSSYHSNPLFQ